MPRIQTKARDKNEGFAWKIRKIVCCAYELNSNERNKKLCTEVH